MSEPKTIMISTTKVPVGPLNYLRPYGKQEGYPEGNASIVRFAIVKLATQLGWKPQGDNRVPQCEPVEKTDAA